MANGYFNISLRDAKGFKDEDFLCAQKEGRIEEMLGSLGEEQQATGTSNMVNGWFAFFLWYRCFAGCAQQQINTANCQSGGNNGFYQTGGGGPCLFGRIVLTSLDTEPSITDCTNYSGNMTGYTNIVTSDAQKGFINGDITDHEVWSDGDGREAVHFRSRWLFLPAEAVSTNIRSIEVAMDSDCDYTTGGYHPRVARARIKDAGGTPITISKTNNQVLLVEYTLTLVSV